jgi:predicted RNase H-like HicB family nuclease
MELTANCERYEGWWVVDVPTVRGLHTQARRLDQVEAMVLDAATLLLGRPKSDFTVTVVPVLPNDESRRIEEAKAARAQLEDAERRAWRASREVVADLRAQGLTVRDVATLIGVTPSRVSQLASAS